MADFGAVLVLMLPRPLAARAARETPIGGTGEPTAINTSANKPPSCMSIQARRRLGPPDLGTWRPSSLGTRLADHAPSVSVLREATVPPTAFPRGKVGKWLTRGASSAPCPAHSCASASLEAGGVGLEQGQSWRGESVGGWVGDGAELGRISRV